MDNDNTTHNEQTSTKLSSLAARVLANPESATIEEIKSLAASALTQAPDVEQFANSNDHATATARKD